MLTLSTLPTVELATRRLSFRLRADVEGGFVCMKGPKAKPSAETAGFLSSGGETAPLSGLRLLVVEDEAIIAFLIEDMLEGLGATVVGVVGDISEALASTGAEGLQIDAAVLDVNLGGKKVDPVADALAATGVPFIFATGYGRDGVAPRFANFPVLAKPFLAEALAVALLSVLGGPPPRIAPD